MAKKNEPRYDAEGFECTMLNAAYYLLTGKQRGDLPFPQTAIAARQAAADGMVLLKNDGTLPLRTRTVALFGAGAEDTVYCGTGSGFVFSPYRVSVREGLERAGFTLSTGRWLQRYQETKKHPPAGARKLTILETRWSGMVQTVEEPRVDRTDLAAQVDTAIYVLSRQAGEGADRKAIPGDYYLSPREEENIRTIAASFAHTVVVLNTCVIDATVLESIPGISAILLMGLAGMEAGNALADILTGAVCPSGRLTDTWAKRYEDYPASASFSANGGNPLQQDYNEDIFVGYRHFDTFSLDALYPFGYGLSYTTFAYEDILVQADWSQVSVTVSVRNIGNVSGREVVQVYTSSPAGKLVKAWQDLQGYGKTKLLTPGEREVLTISFPTEDLASYDESSAAFFLEAGDYAVRVGAHSCSTRIAAWIRLDGDAVVRQVRNHLAPDHPLDLHIPSELRPMEHTEAPVILLHAADCHTIHGAIPEEVVDFSHPAYQASLLDVRDGKVSLEDFTASLDTETLLRLVTGTTCETKHPVPSRLGKVRYESPLAMAASGKTTTQYLSTLAIPGAALADGPAGLHLMGTSAASYPTGMVLAQTWDRDLVARIGDCFGLEMEAANVTVILGPGMNIHRDPLCGRNFEYYSEDPCLTGETAAAFTRGLQDNHPGRGVSLKHFAANSQEEERLDSNSTLSERALREIYLRGFEICVRKANPMTVMTSYNKLNGVHTSSRRDLLTDVLRNEWGFQGLVMTDWDTHSEKTEDLQAGNDLIMGGYPTAPLAAAIAGAAPVFDKDGAVHQDTISLCGGMFKKHIEAWNCFVPDKDGPDTVSTVIPASKKPSPKVQEAIQAGYAALTKGPDGSKEVEYRGTRRPAWLPLADVQRSAYRVLRLLVQNAPMERLRRK